MIINPHTLSVQNLGNLFSYSQNRFWKKKVSNSSNYNKYTLSELIISKPNFNDIFFCKNFKTQSFILSIYSIKCLKLKLKVHKQYFPGAHSSNF